MLIVPYKLNKLEDKEGYSKYDEYNARFMDALNNDLNTSMAITSVYDVLSADMNDKTKLELIKNFDQVLSLDLLSARTAQEPEDDELTAFVLAKIEERKNAKKEKNFARADEIRDILKARGITLKDTPQGVQVIKE